MASKTWTLDTNLHFIQYFMADTLHELLVEVGAFNSVHSDEQNDSGVMIVGLNVSPDPESGWIAEVLCFGNKIDA